MNGIQPEPPPNLRHVAATLAVWRLGSATAAAAALHLTQPAVTQAVASLEAQVGGALFERGSFGMRPTAAAGRAVAHLERLLEAIRTGLVEAAGRAAESVFERQVTATQLRALLDLCTHGSLPSAVRARSTSRATLHRPIRELEDVIDAPLLESTSHGLRPTRTAFRLARRVELALVEWRAARAEVSAQCGPETGSTVVGAMPLARSIVVPAAILEYARRYPRHRISILDGAYESLLEALLAGRADVLVGAVRGSPHPQVVETPLFLDPLVIVARRGHPLAGKSASAPRLREAAWVAPRANSPLRRRFDDLIGESSGPAPIECNSLIAARELLLGSDRLMLASTIQCRHELKAGIFVTVAHPFGAMSRPIGLTQRHNWVPTTAQSDFLLILRQEAAAVQPRVRRRPASTPG